VYNLIINKNTVSPKLAEAGKDVQRSVKFENLVQIKQINWISKNDLGENVRRVPTQFLLETRRKMVSLIQYGYFSHFVSL